MNLDTSNWKEFCISRTKIKPGLFRIENCKCGSAGSLEDGDDINYIGAKKSENGVMRRVSKVNELVSKGNGIIFICDGEGSVGYTNYMDVDFIGSTTTSIGYDESLNQYNALFIVSILDKEKFKFSYGRKYRAHINEIYIKLPVQKNNGVPIYDDTTKYSKEGYVPDWDFMENYIKSLHYKTLTTQNCARKQQKLTIDNWKEFYFEDLITQIYKAKALNKDDLIISNSNNNSIRYITRTRENNGCELIADSSTIPPEYIQSGNAITIGDTTATCFYQSQQFITGDHMVVVRAEWLNEILAQWIVTILNKEQYKYSYGRAFLMDRIKSTIIKLPIKHNNNGYPFIDNTHRYSKEGYVPDWKFMENYIKSLPYGDRL